MAKLDFTRPLLAGAAVLFLILYVQECSRPKVDNSVEQENAAMKTRIAELETGLQEANDSLTQINALRSIENKNAQRDSSRLSIENRRLSVGYSMAKHDIEHLRDSLPALNRYVEAADSLISAKDSLYSAEVRHRMALEELYKSETAALAQKNVIQVQLSEKYAARVDELGKENQRLGKRLERKRKFNNMLLGISGGLLTAVGIMALTN